MTGPNLYEQITVLVVDDMTSTRKLVRKLLLDIGVRTVYEAADGKAGLDEVVKNCPTLVLCDVHMPVMDGMAFLKTLRGFKDRTQARTPVVFLTSDSTRDTVLFAKEHRINGYLVKPVSHADLKSRIDAVLQGTAG